MGINIAISNDYGRDAGRCKNIWVTTTYTGRSTKVRVRDSKRMDYGILNNYSSTCSISCTTYTR